MSTQFEWDDQKAAGNLNKHGVSFEEARSVFENPLAVIFADEAHSESERRELIVSRQLVQKTDNEVPGCLTSAIVQHRAHDLGGSIRCQMRIIPPRGT